VAVGAVFTEAKEECFSKEDPLSMFFFWASLGASKAGTHLPMVSCEGCVFSWPIDFFFFVISGVYGISEEVF
jgi:hypothetical protein